MASCNNLPPSVIVQRKPQPIAPTDNSDGAVAIALKRLYDLYGTCAGRLIDLGNWVTDAVKQ